MEKRLPFEEPLVALEAKIAELRRFMEEQGLDLSEEVARLSARLQALKEETYRNLTPWQKVLIARHPDRPTTLEIAEGMLTDFLELHGDRLTGDDPAIVGGIGLLDGLPVTVIGHQKGRDTKENLARNFGMPHPEGYRKALRLMEQAEKFGRPIITLLNTPGAYPGKAAEERGQSEAIARNLRVMSGLRVPIVVVVVGEGASGGALGIGVGDRILMLEHAWYSVISPEGAAALLWKDAKEAERAAATMKITARDLLALGIIDGIIPEPLGGAHRDKAETIRRIKAAVKAALEELLPLSPEALVEARYAKYRRIGRYTSLFAEGAAADPGFRDGAGAAESAVAAVSVAEDDAPAASGGTRRVDAVEGDGAEQEEGGR
ncbi:MAG: acetyl-CoA carboxylase carboxyltransferase subunit alpha [Hydrogenibacillus schlegelii]|nr:acetyl-CoA carboxylase carboxyltransferase subunit alpha [Hydrogenibacillus schlegelii]